MRITAGMRIMGTLLTAIAVATPLTAQASFGVRAGMTLSTVVGEEVVAGAVSGYATGLHAGVTAHLGSVGPGLLVVSAAYAQRGYKATVPGVDFLKGNVKLAYIDAGAFLKVVFPGGRGPYLLAGPALGLRIGCAGELLGISLDCGDLADPLAKIDFGVSVGAGMPFDVGGRDMVVEALYGYGILDIAESDDNDARTRNRGFTIRVGVDFGR